MCVCIYIYIHIFTHMVAFRYLYMFLYIYLYTYTCIYTYIHISIHLYVYPSIYLSNLHIDRRIYLVYIHVSLGMYVCMHVCVYAHTGYLNPQGPVLRTSITIPDILCVIDSGLARIKKHTNLEAGPTFPRFVPNTGPAIWAVSRVFQSQFRYC